MPRPKAEAFLAIEESLSGPLKKNVSGELDKVVEKSVALAAEGKQDDAEALIVKFSLIDSLKGESSRIRMTGLSAIIFGASRYGPATDTEVAKRKRPPDRLTDGSRQFQAVVRSMDDAAHKQLLGALRASYEIFRLHGELQKADTTAYLGVELDLGALNPNQLVSKIVNTMGSGARRSTHALIDIASSLYASRMASYGFLIESRHRKRAVYKVNEQLDPRTCPVCKIMHGKSFVVGLAYDRLLDLLKVTDPVQLKTQAPWPKQDKESVRILAQMSRDQLVEQGWDTPPYHPLCRGLLDVSEELITEGVPFEPGEIERITAEDLKDSPFEFKVPSDADLEEAWERIFGKAVHPKDIADAYEPLGLSSGDSTFSTFGDALVMDYRGEHGYAKRVFLKDGDEKIVKHSMLEFAGPKQAKGAAKAIMARSLDLYEKMGVDTVFLDANIDVGSYAWARYGAAPNAPDWPGLRMEIASWIRNAIDEGLIQLELLDAAESLADTLEQSRNPKDLWLVADSHIGKLILLGREWSGRFDLNDPEVMRRLNQYIGRD